MRAGQTASQPDQSLLKYKIRSFECDKKSGPGADKPTRPRAQRPEHEGHDGAPTTIPAASTATCQSGGRFPGI